MQNVLQRILDMLTFFTSSFFFFFGVSPLRKDTSRFEVVTVGNGANDLAEMELEDRKNGTVTKDSLSQGSVWH